MLEASDLEAMLDTFSSPGWKLLQAEMQENKDILLAHTLYNTEKEIELWFNKGKLHVIDRFLNMEDSVRAMMEFQAQELEEDV